MADILIYKLAQDIIAACDLVLKNSTIFDHRGSGTSLVLPKFAHNNSTQDEPFMALFGPDPPFSHQPLHPFHEQVLYQPWTYINTSIAFYSPSALFNKAPPGLAYHCLYENGTTVIIADEFVFSEEAKRCKNFEVKKLWDPTIKSRLDYEYGITVPDCSKGNLTLSISWSWAAVGFQTRNTALVVVVDGKELIGDFEASHSLFNRFFMPQSRGTIPPGSTLVLCSRKQGSKVTFTKHFVFFATVYVEPEYRIRP